MEEISNERIFDKHSNSASAVAVTCSECQEAPGVIRKPNKHFCAPCWIRHCNFRFRKRLWELRGQVKGSSGGYRRQADGSFDLSPKENVLIYFDGSTAATALLNLIRNSVAAHLQGGQESSSAFSAGRSASNLPFPFSFRILYLIDDVTDEGEVVTGSRNNETINFLQSWLQETKRKFPLHFPFPLVVTRLENSLSPSSQANQSSNIRFKQIKDQRIEDRDESDPLPADKQLETKLCSILLNLKSKSSRLDFLHILRLRLLVSAAKELGHTKVLLPEDQTSMAVTMFSIMSSGRGEQLAELMNLVTEVDGVELCRPLIELSSDDLRDFVKAEGLEEVAAVVVTCDPRTPIDKKRKIDSVWRQCEEFIVGLQRDYPATVPTLTRIGAKLKPNLDTAECREAEKCKLCQRRLKEVDTINGRWCYGCRSILSDMKRPELLEETFL